MQSSLEFFCEECGAANTAEATHCFACKELLSHSPASLPASAFAGALPVVVPPSSKLQVVAGETPLLETPTYAADLLVPGRILEGRYRIESEIGRGGYSIVYKAVDTLARRRVVTIKQINLHNLTSRQAIEATETFNREITLLPMLMCVGIPRFYGHFTDPGHWYLIMEYIPGQTLEEYLQKSVPDGYCQPVEALKIGIALSSILDYLHSQKSPLIFRDIKPANIMLTRRKKIYLIDFGIIRTFNPNKRKDTTPLGSPGYAAPEQYGRSQSDRRTDIYGLGMTLQTLLTGRDPLELQAGESERTPRPLSPRLQKLLTYMTEPEAPRRPANMLVVRKLLQKEWARLRWFSSLLTGVVLGTLFSVCGVVGSVAENYFVSLGRLNLVNYLQFALIIWDFLLIFLGFMLFVGLFSPTRRYFSLGMVGVIVLFFFLRGWLRI